MEDHSQMILTEQAVRTITQNADVREALLESGNHASVHEDVNGEVTLYINTNNDTVIVEDSRSLIRHVTPRTEDFNSSNDTEEQNKTTEKSDDSPTTKNTSDFASILNLHQKNSMSHGLQSMKEETQKYSYKVSIVDALRQEIAMHERRSIDHDTIVNALKMNISLFEKRMTDQEEIINVTKQKYETQVEALQDKVQMLQEKISELVSNKYVIIKFSFNIAVF